METHTPGRLVRASSGGRAVASDALFVAVIVLLSFSPYVAKIGFYSDDWDLLAKMAGARDGSFASVFTSINAPLLVMRPAQVAYFALLYKAFGLDPLGYHVVNGIMLIGLAMVCGMVLRELGESRVDAASVALVYALSPNYSTIRYWFASFAHLLSVVLYGVSLYAALRSVRAGDRLPAGGWTIVSVVTLVLSTLCFEVPLPFFLITAWAIWRTPRRPLDAHRVVGLPWTRAVNLVGTCLAVTAIVLFKAATTRRLDSSSVPFPVQVATILGRAFDLAPAVPESYGLNVWRAVETNFGAYGVRLPQTVVTLVSENGSRSLLVLCGLVFALVAAYLYSVAGRSEESGQRRIAGLNVSARFMLSGLVVFWLGYAIFLTNSSIQFTPTGIGNRANIGAALGVALLLVGIVRAGAGLLPVEALRTPAFCLVIAAVCASELLIDNVLATHWVTAYRREGEILAAIRNRIEAPPPQSTVILAGACPYEGPAIVFESNWDLAGALRLIYGDATLNADVVSSQMVVDERGVTTMIYGAPTRHQFGESLILYDYQTDAVTRLTDEATAKARLMLPERAGQCPPGHEGLGAAAW